MPGRGAMSFIERPGGRAPASRFPGSVLGISLIASMMWLAFELQSDEAARLWLDFWGFSPAEIVAALDRDESLRRLVSLVTAVFVHASGLHLAGNLAYLWVFGIAVERAIGHMQFLVAFLLFGALANYSVVFGSPELERTVVGASGGVSAVIGLYLGLFPSRRIGVWLPLGLFLQFARIPALLVIGSWFTLQLLYWVFGPMSGAVAWWTHVAGFLAGLVAAALLRLRGRPSSVLSRGD